MEVGESGEERTAAGAWKRDLISLSHQICHSYLQNFNFATQNYKNATPRHLVLAYSLI